MADEQVKLMSERGLVSGLVVMVLIPSDDGNVLVNQFYTLKKNNRGRLSLKPVAKRKEKQDNGQKV
jgi:hypothetical protein